MSHVRQFRSDSFRLDLPNGGNVWAIEFRLRGKEFVGCVLTLAETRRGLWLAIRPNGLAGVGPKFLLLGFWFFFFLFFFMAIFWNFDWSVGWLVGCWLGQMERKKKLFYCLYEWEKLLSIWNCFIDSARCIMSCTKEEIFLLFVCDWHILTVRCKILLRINNLTNLKEIWGILILNFFPLFWIRIVQVWHDHNWSDFFFC